MPEDAVNLHACAVVLDDRGVLITGHSGAGKTLLALGLIDHWHMRARHACLVADDQVFVVRRSGMLVALAPMATRGLAEARFCGPIAVPYEPACVLDLHVELVSAREPPRVQQDERRLVAGVGLPALQLPEGNLAAAILAVRAALPK